MVRPLFDTNILIDHLNGVPEARAERLRYRRRAISIVKGMEVMAGAGRDGEAATRAFLKGFEVIGIDETIAGRAVDLRRRRRIKLPDAIILATAQGAAHIRQIDSRSEQSLEINRTICYPVSPDRNSPPRPAV